MESSDVKYFSGTFKNKRGQRLFHRRYLPLDGKPARAVLIFHHGYPGHSGLFDCDACQVFAMLQQRGIAVFAYDAHSFGRSEPSAAADRLYVQSMAHLVDDVITFREVVVAGYLESVRVPVFLGGLSMGGLVAAVTALHSPELWQGLVLLAPAIDVIMNPVRWLMLRVQSVMVRIVPRLAIVPGVNINDTTPDPAVQEMLLTDPLIPFRKVRVATASSLLDGFAQLRRREGELTLPIFLAESGEDRAVSSVAIRRFAKNVGTPPEDLQYKLYKGAPHLLLHSSPWREEVVNDVAAWILSRSP